MGVAMARTTIPTLMEAPTITAEVVTRLILLRLKEARGRNE